MNARTGGTGKIDVGSIQVARYDSETGEPVKGPKWNYAHEDWEVPYRWYDDAIPQDFPERDLDVKTGALTPIPQPNWGYLYETQGECAREILLGRTLKLEINRRITQFISI